MTRPLLFLLDPSFPDPKVGPGSYHCPHCAAVEGLLAWHPEVRARLEVRAVGFARPRHAVIAELGEENQVCPVLILPPEWPNPPAWGRRANGRTFFVGAMEIPRFLSEWAGTSMPHP